MSDVKEKVEMELKPFETMCDATTEHLRTMITGSCEATADEILTVAKALGEIVDIKKDIVEMCYKKQIMTAMEEHEDEYGETWDEDGVMYYSGQPRSKTSGRYMSRGDGRRTNGRMYTPNSEWRMNMDLYRMSPEELRMRDREMGVHYYEPGDYTGIGNNNRDDRGTRNMNTMKDANVRSYSENGTDSINRNNGMNQSQSRIDKAIKHYHDNNDMQSLEEMLNAIQEKIMEESGGMDVSKKNMTKSKLTNLINNIK
ncbi:MAG: hypothetical protein MJ236_05235 [Clostridia bacterium]|nr:hypothetical protein [Clostridia bacterium]